MDIKSLLTSSFTSGGTRTRNPRLRRPVPYPLGHRGLKHVMSRVLDRTQEIQGQNKTTNLDTGLSSVRHVWTS